MRDLFTDKNISPMLMYETEPFNDVNYIFELKLDGIRCLAYLGDNATELRNKRNKNVTEIYPELKEIHQCAKKKCILDGELVVFNDGVPDFYALQARSLKTDTFKIKLASKKNPVQFVAYDILYCDGERITDRPLMERKKIMENNLNEANGLSISRYIEREGIKFFELAKSRGLEGIVAKEKSGKYYIGKRTRKWLKIKVMQEEDLIICGYQTDDNGYPKDIVLGEKGVDGKLEFRGKVFLGVSKEERALLHEYAIKGTTTAHFELKGDIVWLEPKLIGTVRYMHVIDGGFRQPVWKGIKE